MTSITQEELVATLTERFGEDPSGWAFICPNCQDVASVADFREALKAHPRHRGDEVVIASDVIGEECIGRSLGALAQPAGKWRGRGCDWVAYGLIGGPVTVTTAEGKSFSAFRIAEPVKAAS